MRLGVSLVATLGSVSKTSWCTSSTSTHKYPRSAHRKAHEIVHKWLNNSYWRGLRGLGPFNGAPSSYRSTTQVYIKHYD